MIRNHERVVHGFLDHILGSVDAERIILITDDVDALKYAPTTSIVVSPSDDVLNSAAQHRASLRVDTHLLRGLAGLDDIRTIILETIALGYLEPGRTLVLVLMDGMPSAALILDPRDEPLVEAMRIASKRGVDPRVFQAVMSLSVQVAREGREGRPAGALFILGEPSEVLPWCHQGVLNPFHGHPPERRDARRGDCAESIKTYATVDGAILLSPQGLVEAAGLYVMFDEDDVPSPRPGGRHIAAAAITRKTRALAVVVSQEGTVRVVADGQVLATLGHVR